MNELEAAIGVEQLKRLATFKARRDENNLVLRKALADIEELYCLFDGNENSEHAHYCVVALLGERFASNRPYVIEELRKLGVGTSVYYPGPVPHLSYYKNKYNLGDVRFVNAEKISKNSLAFPVGPHLSGEDMEYIGSALKVVLSKGLTK